MAEKRDRNRAGLVGARSVLTNSVSRRSFLAGSAGGAAAPAVAGLDARALAGGAYGSRARVLRQERPDGATSYRIVPSAPETACE